MNVLITGSDGFLGGKIIKKLIEDTEFNVLALTMSMNRVEEMLQREKLGRTDRILYMINDDFLKYDLTDWDIYGAVHLAFSRRMQPAEDIASSIRFAASVFHKLADCSVDHVINMSSQGVYGNTEEIRTEETIPAPTTQYTMAKYAAEVLFNDIMKGCRHCTNLRLDPVAQSQNVLQGLCRSAIQGKIIVRGGRQVFSFIDANDVPGAVVAMLQAGGEWEKVYNVGWNRKRYTLIELAGLVADAAERCGYARPDIELEEADIPMWAGMDSSRFMEKTGWVPKIDLMRSIETMMRR